MVYQAIKSVILFIMKSSLDLASQFILLFSFIYVTTVLGIVAIVLEFLDSAVVEYYRRSGPRDTIIEKTVFSSIFDFLEQFLPVVRGFIERRQDNISLLNDSNMSKIEMFKQNFVHQSSKMAQNSQPPAANFK